MILSRRQFIRTGLAGSLLLSLSGWLNAAGARRLSIAEREMLGALCNAMLEGMLPTDPTLRRRLVALTVDGVAIEVAGLSLAAQKEVGELFGLLVLTPARLLLAGVAEDVGRDATTRAGADDDHIEFQGLAPGKRRCVDVLPAGSQPVLDRIEHQKYPCGGPG